MSNIKEPWLAVFLSFYLPGAGQLYAGNSRAGVATIAATFFLLSFGFHSFITEQGNAAFGMIAFSIYLLLWFASLIIAYRSARAANSPEQELARKQNKDPWLAAFLSFMLLGSGFIYLRRWLYLVAYWIVIVALMFLWNHYDQGHQSPFTRLLLRFISISLYGTVGFLTYLTAPVHREKSPRTAAFVLLGISGCSALLFSAVILVRAYVVEPYNVPGRSMQPTIMDGDRILVWKRLSNPLKRGQLLTFKEPSSGTMYVKRVVAFGGEIVEIKDGRLHISGAPITDPPFDKIVYTQSGVKAVMGNSFRVHSNYVFFLGDNSERSKDSRSFGDVPEDTITGIVYKIWWPPDRAQAIDSNAGK
jgi:signal peptidase I